MARHPINLLNILYYLICLVASLGAELASDGTLASFIPPKWAHLISVAAVGAGWLKSHWNYFKNPDGTPATQPYAPGLAASARTSGQ